MSMPADERQLRLELLRLRGEMQRAELSQAAGELRAGAQRAGQWMAVASQFSASLGGGRRGWLYAAASALRLRPWLIPVAGGALRLARRHPLPAVVAALAAVAAARALRRSREEPPAQ
ncbi:MAG: hypothetical protein ACK6DI_08220 [Betaproteobacteria bacterium]